MEDEVKIFRINLGKRIAQIRKQKGLEQTELAAMLNGKDKQFINRYENQGANPTAFLLVQLAKALSVSMEELLDFSKLSD
ncbi:transcriptional regulator with XRE-family HTH domain [Pedobacter sp. AK017]|uniref:helix-turn-helix domain-containing protein n=1 Tax=Pedobacter sp. AK017 TaxID=2723073 RepID=UPI001619C88E|nr:helix-turn-helix transcriptional regulator [Pedobacter sp. AK017]MBB5438551.1 transcriptional regulator with XRE-family HTH domain [Pedobacter sp. AK017]